MSGSKRDVEAPAPAGLRHPALPGLVVLALMVVCLFRRAFDSLLQGILADPDSYLHVVRLREILAHGWRHGLVARDNTPYGFFMHWTMPWDLQAMALAWPFERLGFDHDKVLVVASGLSSVLDLALLVVLAAWVIRPFGGRLGAAAAGLLIAGALPLLGYGAPGRAGHHILQLVAVAFCFGLVFRALAPRARALLLLPAAGLAAAFALWVSLENFPFVLFAVALPPLARAWTGAPAKTWVLGASAAAASALILLVDGSAGGFFADEIDRISIVYLDFFLLLAVACLGADLAVRRLSSAASPLLRVVVSAALLLLGGALWLALDPEVLQGPAAVVGPDLVRLWWNAISELQPLTTVQQLLAWAGTGFLGAALLGVSLAKAPRDDLRAGLLLGLLGTLASVALAVMHLRFGEYAALAGALSGGGGLGRLLEGRVLPPRRLLILGLSLAFLPAIAGVFAPAWRFVPAAPAASSMGRSGRPACDVRVIARLLDDPAFMKAAPASLMSDINAAPEILYWTKTARTVAGPYQRNVDGLTDSYAFFRDAAPGAPGARAIADRRFLTHVLVCVSSELPSYEVPGREDLYDRLKAGAAPAWLEKKPWPSGLRTGYLLYRIKPAAPLSPMLDRPSAR